MEEKRRNAHSDAKQEEAVDKYPGIAVYEADNDVVDEQLVKERTCELNNNPRNDK